MKYEAPPVQPNKDQGVEIAGNESELDASLALSCSVSSAFVPEWEI